MEDEIEDRMGATGKEEEEGAQGGGGKGERVDGGEEREESFDSVRSKHSGDERENVETKEIVVPDAKDVSNSSSCDELPSSFRYFVDECREVFAFFDTKQRGTLPLNIAGEAVQSLGLCPFDMELLYFRDLAVDKRFTFSDFVTVALRVKKREEEGAHSTEKVVCDAWEALNKFLGHNGKMLFSQLRGNLQIMGEPMSAQDVNALIGRQSRYVDHDGMVDVTAWIASLKRT